MYARYLIIFFPSFQVNKYLKPAEGHFRCLATRSHNISKMSPFFLALTEFKDQNKRTKKAFRASAEHDISLH